MKPHYTLGFSISITFYLLSFLIKATKKASSSSPDELIEALNYFLLSDILFSLGSISIAVMLLYHDFIKKNKTLFCKINVVFAKDCF